MELSSEKIELKSKIYYHFFEPVSQSLSEINYAIIKGEPLSYYAYGQYGKRYFHDIDLLVSKQELSTVEKILLNNSFLPLKTDKMSRLICVGFSHQIIPYVKRIGEFSIYIDVNYSVFWGEYTGKRISTEDFLLDTVPMQIYNCSIKTLSPIKFFVQLILHHYKDLNSIFILSTHKKINRMLFQDLYNYFINNYSFIPINALLNFCNEYNIAKYVYYILYYTCLLYDNRLLREYRDAFKSKDGEELLGCYGLSENERKEWRVDFQTRLNSDNIYDLIRTDLTEKDIEKITLNKKVFFNE